MKKLVLSSMALTMLAGHAHAQSSVTLSGTIYGGLGLNSGGVKSNTTAAGTSSFMLSGKEDIGGGSAVLFKVENGFNADTAMDSTDRAERERALSAAKVTMGRIGARVAEESIQLHGGIGMTWELPLSHYAKRLVMVDHQFGDEDHHLARFIELGRS